MDFLIVSSLPLLLKKFSISRNSPLDLLGCMPHLNYLEEHSRAEPSLCLCTHWCLLDIGTRGVQYVHCVMHKCIIVKVGGSEKHMKYVKTGKFAENRGKF